MPEKFFNKLQQNYCKGTFAETTTFYFSIDDISTTLIVDADSCRIEDGKTVAEPDCTCKTTKEMMSRILNDGYRPGIMDFMSGAIVTNAPLLLPRLLKAFNR